MTRLYAGVRHGGTRGSFALYLFVPFDAPGSIGYDAAGIAFDIVAPL
jgi:hypothetical protein